MTEPAEYGQRDDLESDLDIDLEAPESDALDQRTSSYDDENEPTYEGETPIEADPADTADQHRTAGTDDDDYDR
jgi:hypothetical protein